MAARAPAGWIVAYLRWAAVVEQPLRARGRAGGVRAPLRHPKLPAGYLPGLHLLAARPLGGVGRAGRRVRRTHHWRRLRRVPQDPERGSEPDRRGGHHLVRGEARIRAGLRAAVTAPGDGPRPGAQAPPAQAAAQASQPWRLHAPGGGHRPRPGGGRPHRRAAPRDLPWPGRGGCLPGGRDDAARDRGRARLRRPGQRDCGRGPGRRGHGGRARLPGAERRPAAGTRLGPGADRYRHVRRAGADGCGRPAHDHPPGGRAAAAARGPRGARGRPGRPSRACSTSWWR